MSSDKTERLVGISQIVAKDGSIPIFSQTWWRGVAIGRYSKPIPISLKTFAGKLANINRLIEEIEEMHHVK